jgi:hypothetical protein
MIIYFSNKNVSSFQAEVIELLNKKYPTHRIFIEVPIQFILGGIEHDLKKRVSRFHIDIYDTTNQIAYEVQGSQHDKYNKFFHGNINNYETSKINDSLKKRVLEDIGIELVYINSIKEAKEILCI